jgi:hypothetical protein
LIQQIPEQFSQLRRLKQNIKRVSGSVKTGKTGKTKRRQRLNGHDASKVAFRRSEVRAPPLSFPSIRGYNREDY